MNFKTLEPGETFAHGENPQAGEIEVCGPCRWVIRRNSIDFRTLLVEIDDVRLADTKDPLLKDSFRMHPCMRPAFHRLLELAAEEAIVVEIIRAWDGSDAKNLENLHGEGRTLCLTAQNHKPEDIAVLSRLAQEAGFDWLKREPDHISVSCRNF